MADDTRALRERIEERRSDISETVEQIENRIMPGRIMARRSDRVRRTLSGWKDAVLGTDDDDGGAWSAYSTSGRPMSAASADDAGLADRAGSAVATARDAVGGAVHEAPEMVRQRTTGNPLAAGAVALGVGWIVGSAMPKTAREQALARRVEPVLGEAAHGVLEEGKAIAEELREPAREAAEHVQQAGAQAAEDLRGDVAGAAREVRDQTGGRSSV